MSKKIIIFLNSHLLVLVTSHGICYHDFHYFGLLLSLGYMLTRHDMSMGMENKHNEANSYIFSSESIRGIIEE